MEHHEDLHLIVVSPESTLFDGKVEIVTLPGELGSFSVLYDHAPLISSLIKGEIKYTEDELEKSIGISSGFVEEQYSFGLCGNLIHNYVFVSRKEKIYHIVDHINGCIELGGYFTPCCLGIILPVSLHTDIFYLFGLFMFMFGCCYRVSPQKWWRFTWWRK